MYIKAKLVFQSFIPTEFKKGMLFKQRIKDVIYGNVYEYDRIFALNHIPADRESYIITNGYPVLPTIISIPNNPDEESHVLATSEIGWWDDNPFDSSDDAELRDIEIKDYNVILSDYDGVLQIEVNDNAFAEGIVKPILFMDKVTLREPVDEEEDYDEDDHINWDDDNPYEN